MNKQQTTETLATGTSMMPNIISSRDSFDNLINSGDEITLEQREHAVPVLVMAAVGTQRRSIHNVPDTTTIPSNGSHVCCSK